MMGIVDVVRWWYDCGAVQMKVTCKVRMVLVSSVHVAMRRRGVRS
jgi:hypothetical protein